MKTKKAFLKNEINVDQLTVPQWDGIMRAMENYANHYHESQKEKLVLI
jgi:hypothetical protein